MRDDAQFGDGSANMVGALLLFSGRHPRMNTRGHRNRSNGGCTSANSHIQFRGDLRHRGTASPGLLALHAGNHPSG